MSIATAIDVAEVSEETKESTFKRVMDTKKFHVSQFVSAAVSGLKKVVVGTARWVRRHLGTVVVVALCLALGAAGAYLSVWVGMSLATVGAVWAVLWVLTLGWNLFFGSIALALMLSAKVIEWDLDR